MKRILLFSISASFLFSCTYYIGPNRWAKSFPDDPVIVPHSIEVDILTYDASKLLDIPSLQNAASGNIESYSDKYKDTVLDPRIIFAKLLLKEDIKFINETILKYEAFGTTGTSHKLNKKGDYDFRQIIFTQIVWYFKDAPEILFPATAEHIIDKLIIDNGFKPTLKAPKVFGLIRETENHILMKETARYLKNQWLFNKNPLPKYNNTANGMSVFLIAHLQEMKKTGFFEFNANPYISFTFEALHVLYNHSNDTKIKELAKEVMDAENWQYALGSFDLKKYSPFRRRMNRASETSLIADRHSILIRAELAKSDGVILSEDELQCCYDRTLITTTSTYQLPIQIKATIEVKPSQYYAKIGHGLKASPELYSGTPLYLMSAGGIRFGKRSQITPRPLSVILHDNVYDIEECFHIKGSGKLNQWNNTGLYKNLIVGNQEVSVPDSYTAIMIDGIWTIYKVYPDEELYVCVHSSPKFGALFIGDANYNNVLAMNQSSKVLKHQFCLADQQIVSYNTKTKKKWVIKKTPEGAIKRKFKRWPRFDVRFE